MTDIVVRFYNQPPIQIELNRNPTVEKWRELLIDNLSKQTPLCRDPKKYTVSYLNQLIKDANRSLHWNFDCHIQSIKQTVELHKHIESLLAQGFENIPAEFDNLIHELHYCLHSVEQNLFIPPTVMHHIQVEWFNDDGFALDYEFQHAPKLQFGDVRLQNPYVGHIPLQVYFQNDYKNIMQTCKFHDFVKPGFYISGVNDSKDPLDMSAYTNWWNKYASDFVDLHGMEKILHYTGHPVIGRVTNLNEFTEIINCKDVLELHSVEVF